MWGFLIYGQKKQEHLRISRKSIILNKLKQYKL